MILNKRIKRELIDNKFRYGALFFLIVLSISIVVSMAAASDSVFYTIGTNKEDNHVEDGEFTVFAPYSQAQINEIEQLGVTLEENFYVDMAVVDKSTLRVFKNRELINTLELDEGELANDANEIVIEKHFAGNHGLNLDDQIVIDEKEYTVTGIGSVPDYASVLKNPFDVVSNTEDFSLAFISDQAFEELIDQDINVTFSYSYLLNGDVTDKELMDYLVDMDFDVAKVTNPYILESVKQMQEALANQPIDENSEANRTEELRNLTYFIQNENNARINDAEADSAINKLAALIAGVIIVLLIAYILSVFIIHNIEKESAVIGALYSMGYLKKDLVKHFMILPLVLAAIASITGTVLGYYLIPYMEDASSYYSFPELQVIVQPYVIFYGIVVPILITAVVNFIVINKKLSLEPLKLLRQEKNQNGMANIDLGNMNFINRYRIRQIIREIRGYITIVFGLFLAILLMVFGFGIKGTIDNYVKQTADDAKFEYMYVLQYPENEVPNGGEEAYSESLYAYLDIADKDLEVNILGIKEGSPYFDFIVEGDTNDVYISDSVALKYVRLGTRSN